MEKLLKVLELYKNDFIIRIKTTRLPENKLDVFGKITVHEDNEKLEVRCHIVYGNPVKATIVNDLVTDDSEVIPFRDTNKERKISNIFSSI